MSSAAGQILMEFWHLQAQGCLPQEQGRGLEKVHHTLKDPAGIQAPAGVNTHSWEAAQHLCSARSQVPTALP